VTCYYLALSWQAGRRQGFQPYSRNLPLSHRCWLKFDCCHAQPVGGAAAGLPAVQPGPAAPDRGRAPGGHRCHRPLRHLPHHLQGADVSGFKGLAGLRMDIPFIDISRLDAMCTHSVPTTIVRSLLRSRVLLLILRCPRRRATCVGAWSCARGRSTSRPPGRRRRRQRGTSRPRRPQLAWCLPP